MADFERLEFHDLRHTFASLMIAAGASPLQLAEALGDTDQNGRPDRRSCGNVTATSIQDLACGRSCAGPVLKSRRVLDWCGISAGCETAGCCRLA
jgi:hypothetical protein